MKTKKHADSRDRGSASTTPISIRFTDEEITELKSLAGNLSVSEYVRRRLFSESVEADLFGSGETRLTPQARQKLLAQILIRLGKLDNVKNVNLLIEALQTGLIDASGETSAALNALHQEIEQIRHTLLKALGLRP